MFTYFFSLIIIIFEVICYKMFVECFCDVPKEHKKWYRAILMVLLVAVFYLYGLLLSNWLLMKLIAAILTGTIIMHFYFMISLRKAVVFTMLYHGTMLVIDFLVYVGNQSVLSQSGAVNPGYALEGNLLVAICKMIEFVCVLLLKRHFRKRSAQWMTDTAWIKFLFFPMFSIITISAMIATFPHMENQMQADVLYAIALGIVVMNVFIYYLISDMVSQEAKLHEKEMLELQVKNQMEMYRSISEHNELQKNRTHEFKNQMLCIESLLQNKEYDEATWYVSKISNSLMGGQNAIDTNHVIINAILNTKYQEAASKHIVFACRVNDLSGVKMEDEDLVVILANLLNNAIEACEKCTDRKSIKFKFMIEDGMIILSVKNTYHQPLVYEAGEIKTSKLVDPQEHGIGIKNIIRIVEKYGGEYVIQDNEKELYFSILIPV